MLDVVTKAGNSPLMFAALSGNTECADILISKGAALEIQHPATGATALHMASQEGHEDIVRLLVRAGARMDSYQKDGLCPLHMAAQFNRGEVVRTLVGLGCDRDMVSSAGVLLGR